MRIWEKKRTIDFLEKLRVRNYKSAYIYRIAYNKENRLILKNFYQRLYLQKLEFKNEIEEKIEQLKKEISPIKDPKLLSFYRKRKCDFDHLYMKYKLQHRYADIHRRELKSLKKYKKCLSRTSHAGVRELLLAHKHKLKSNLLEMQSTGVMKFPVA